MSRKPSDKSPVSEVEGEWAYDRDKVDETVLALLHLTSFQEKIDEQRRLTRAWKSQDWDVLHRLHLKGFIEDPINTNKSVILTEEGASRSEELFERHFGKKRSSD